MHFINDFAQRAKNYIETQNEEPVFPTEEAIQQLDQLNKELNTEPIEPAAVLNLLDTIGSPATVKSTGGRYFGFVTGGSLPAALNAKLLATVWDQNVALSVMSPIVSKLETVTGNWLLKLFGLPDTCGFGFVTGDTMANFTALAAARHSLLKNAGWNVEENGLFGAPEIVVMVSDEIHSSVLKALRLLGLGSGRIVRIPCDEQGRMKVDALPNIHQPSIICTQAGNVNTGSFDPIKEICSKIKTQNVWVHVDGAFGMWAAASNNKKHLTDGIELAHSWATDAHKWLNVPYDSGVVFVRDKEALFAAMSSSAAYLPTDAVREPFNYVPEMSRQARAVPVWAALQSLGINGLAKMIDTHCNQAVMFAKGLTDAGFSVLNEVVLNQVLVSFGDASTTQQVIKNVQQQGVCWCGGTVWQGKAAMRISVSNWSTTNEDVQQSLRSIIHQANEVREVVVG